MDARARDDRVVDLRRHGEEALAVVDGLPLVDEAQVGKVVHQDPVVQRHRYSVAPQLDRAHLRRAPRIVLPQTRVAAQLTPPVYKHEHAHGGADRSTLSARNIRRGA